jgi:hypothetical protein
MLKLGHFNPDTVVAKEIRIISADSRDMPFKRVLKKDSAERDVRAVRAVAKKTKQKKKRAIIS